MRHTAGLIALCLTALAPIARAYEYPLQFTPNPGYRNLLVAGYQFAGNTIIGACSYYTVTSTNSGGGRGGGGHNVVTTNYDQTCTWDLFGNLLSITPVAAPAPAPLYTKGTLTIYAVNGNGSVIGVDSSLPAGGFVNTQGAHYSWLTPNASAVLKQSAYTQVIELVSDGDQAVTITAVSVSAKLGLAVLKSTTCNGTVEIGQSCSVTVTYDPTAVSAANNASTVSDTLRIDLTSSAAQAGDFIQNYTIVVASIDQ